jgi:hypothetical protein
VVQQLQLEVSRTSLISSSSSSGSLMMLQARFRMCRTVGMVYSSCRQGQLSTSNVTGSTEAS